MNACRYAFIMENSIRQEVILRMQNDTMQLKPILEMVSTCQETLINILQQVISKVDLSTYPELNALQVLFDTNWTENFKFEICKGETTEQLMDLYMNLSALSSITERSLQFYRQAANNSAYEYEKIFFNSLAEQKKVIKRRIDSALRVVYNSLWSQVGFAPFIFGKE
ncbi:hypothetical protein SDC9_95651 [bioreactor metagenome]|uniref:Uncharacterized protein n=1 Tax=bioreactor metagenome TaxID=1076179 RepID=A0A645AH05_9ZZZZ